MGEVEQLRSSRPVARGAIERLRDQLALQYLRAPLDGQVVVPDDERFKAAFSQATVSNHDLARYYLRALERAANPGR